ncbi:26300_t:CDS:2, partial [Racocetra persica]
HLRDFSSIYEDLEAGIERDARRMVISTIPRQDLNNARDLNNRIILSQPKKSQTEIPKRSCDKRQRNVDLSRARRELKAEDPLPDG